MSDFQPAPVIEQTFYTANGPVVVYYELSNKTYHKAQPHKDQRVDQHFLSAVMDKMNWLIPDDQKDANLAYYTPLRKYLRTMWFVYHVRTKANATNAEFSEKYKDTSSEFHKRWKYSDVAVDALVSLMTDAKNLANASEVSWKDARSLEWAVKTLTDEKDYLHLAEQRQAVAASENGE